MHHRRLDVGDSEQWSACAGRGHDDFDDVEHRSELFEGDHLIRSAGQQRGALHPAGTHHELQPSVDEFGDGLGSDETGAQNEREAGGLGRVGPSRVEAELG